MDTDLNDISSKLITKGYKITPQRKHIIAYLMQSTQHPTARTIATELNLNLATVYNTLTLLEKEQIIISIDNDAKGEKSFDYFGKPHYHLVCSNCGKIIDRFDLDMTQLFQQVAKSSSYTLNQIHLEFIGLCPDCQKLQKEGHLNG